MPESTFRWAANGSGIVNRPKPIAEVPRCIRGTTAVIMISGMTAPPKPTKRGYDPEAASFSKRKCDNCGLPYKPKQKPRKGQKYGFCKPKCKWQFHKHGAAFIQLKGAVEKMLDGQVKDYMHRPGGPIAILSERVWQLEHALAELQSKTKGPKTK